MGHIIWLIYISSWKPYKRPMKLYQIKMLTSMNKTSHLNFIFSVSVFFLFLCEVRFQFLSENIFKFFRRARIFWKFSNFSKNFFDFLWYLTELSLFGWRLMVFGLIFWRLLLCTISSNEQFLFFSGAKGAEGIKMFRKEHGGEARNVENGGGHHHCTTRSDFEIDADYYFHRFSFLTG